MPFGSYDIVASTGEVGDGVSFDIPTGFGTVNVAPGQSRQRRHNPGEVADCQERQRDAGTLVDDVDDTEERRIQTLTE